MLPLDAWFIAFIITILLVFATVFHVLMAVFGKVQLFPAGPSFDKSSIFSAQAKQRLIDNDERMQGTLSFWKNRAVRYGRLYNYMVVWSIVSAVVIPILIQEYSSTNFWARMFLTVLSGWTALIVALSRGFKAEELFRGFRHWESEYYDLRRRMLDNPETLGSTEEEQLKTYFENVEIIRKSARNTETNNFPAPIVS